MKNVAVHKERRKAKDDLHVDLAKLVGVAACAEKACHLSVQKRADKHEYHGNHAHDNDGVGEDFVALVGVFCALVYGKFGRAAHAEKHTQREHKRERRRREVERGKPRVPHVERDKQGVCENVARDTYHGDDVCRYVFCKFFQRCVWLLVLHVSPIKKASCLHLQKAYRRKPTLSPGDEFILYLYFSIRLYGHFMHKSTVLYRLYAILKDTEFAPCLWLKNLISLRCLHHCRYCRLKA